jgi:hypothetical protein
MKKLNMIIGATLIAPALLFGQKVDIKLNLENGKTYTQTTELSSSIKQSMMGQQMEIQSSGDSQLNLELAEDNGAVDTYDAWYSKISVSSSAMGQSQSFSSDTSSLANVDETSRVFAMMTDKKFTAKITEKGMVEEVNGLDEMVQEAASKMQGGPGMMETVKNSIGIDGFTKNLEMTTDIFPEGKVKVGDSWTKEQFLSVGLPIISNTTYTFQSLENGVATIGVEAQFTTDPNNATTNIQGLDATQFYEGSRSGSLMVEASSGWVTSGELKDDIVGSITVAPNAQMPDGMTIPLEVANTIKISN